jgi:signal transduction histidine kinase
MSGGAQLSPEQAERLHKFSHDLKNRLSGLYQALQHVTTDEASDRGEFLQFGEQQFFKAMREIESLMDDLQVERGARTFKKEAVPLADVIKEAADGLRHRFERKEQELVMKLDDPVNVAGDRHYILETISALLSNASKFSPHESPVEVVLQKKDDHAELCVIDQGVGLTEADLQNIFVRYAWLGSRSTAGEAQGRGTLAKARQYAEGMGGTLEAASEGSGRGCSFSLRLPLA